MIGPIHQFVNDAQAVLKKQLASDEQIAEAYRLLEQDGFQMRLSYYLRQLGVLSDDQVSDVEHLDSGEGITDAEGGDSLVELETLNEKPSEPSGVEDTSSSSVQADESSGGEYETLQESDDSLTPQRDVVAPRLQLSRFKKKNLHDEGGLGKVWVAEDQELRRLVALKEIQPEHADEQNSRQRFTLEASITGSLEHPGIVPVYGLGANADGRPYYAMRFIKGQTLKKAIEILFDSAPSKPFQDRAWFEQFRKLLTRFLYVCSTIEYAHSKRVLHRDIKPSNIMLGDYEETLVVDWGLSKVLGDEESVSFDATSDTLQPISSDSNLTFDGAAVGTPAYMSPEQAAGELGGVSFTADVFSLGATLFHLLVGDAPKQVRGDRSELERKLLHAPAPLRSICLRCLHKKPGDRYQSAGELSAEIERWLTGQAVQTHEESNREKLNRWIGNHPTAVTTSVVAFFLIFAATIGGLAAYAQVRRSIDAERFQREQLAERHITQVQNAVDSNLDSAKIEIRNGRFKSALEFLDQAIELADAEQETVSFSGGDPKKIRDRTRQLVDFYTLTHQGEEFAFRDSSRRASAMLQRALVAVNVFQQKEWWSVLPDDDLTPSQQHDLREQVYRSIFLLAALRLKETLPDELNVIEMLKLVTSTSQKSNEAAIVLFDLLDSYRESQGAQLGRQFAENRQEILSKAITSVAFQQPLIKWKARNAADLYLMGSALSYMCMLTDEQERERFAKLLGIGDAEQAAEDMLRQASELQKDEYWTQVVRAFFEEQRGDYEEAWRSYLHTVSLDPDNWVAYAWLGTAQRNYAVQRAADGSTTRETFLSRSSKNLELAVELNPVSNTAHYERGHTLTWRSPDPREPLASYLLGLEYQEPLELINDVTVRSVDEDSLAIILEWCEIVAKEWDVPDLDACRAMVHLTLGDSEEALSEAQRALAKEPTNREALLVVATLLISQKKYDEAQRQLLKIIGWDSWYPSAMAMARATEGLGKKQEAQSLFVRAFEFGAVDWQKRESQRNVARIALELEQDDAVEKLQLALDFAVSERLDDLLEVVGNDQKARELVLSHHSSLLPITRLRSDAPVQIAPVFNGSFELGFTRCWGDSLSEIDQPTWKRFGGSIARAAASDSQSVDGEYSLHLTNPISTEAGSYSELAQQFPVLPGGNYTVRVSFLSRTDKKGAVEICIDGETVLTSPARDGTEKWKTLEGVFTPKATQAIVSIRCLGKCDIYVDALSVVAN